MSAAAPKSPAVVSATAGTQMVDLSLLSRSPEPQPLCGDRSSSSSVPRSPGAAPGGLAVEDAWAAPEALEPFGPVRGAETVD